jgi:primosomal protein N' (replication factor Y) (superfamily II helicase)
VIVQTYWPYHPAIMAAALHDPRVFYEEEETLRASLGYPPYARLANILFWGEDKSAVAARAGKWAEALESTLPDDWSVLGPSPAPISRIKGVWRWHILVKAPLGASLADALVGVEHEVPTGRLVSHAIDIDAVDVL